MNGVEEGEAKAHGFQLGNPSFSLDSFQEGKTIHSVKALSITRG